MELGGEDWEPKFEATSKASIDEVQSLKVEALPEAQGCLICFEGFEIGNEATRMPCLPFFM